MALAVYVRLEPLFVRLWTSLAYLAERFDELPDGGRVERDRETVRSLIRERLLSGLDETEWPARLVPDPETDHSLVEVGPPASWRHEVRALEAALSELEEAWPHGEVARWAGRSRRAAAAFRRRWAP